MGCLAELSIDGRQKVLWEGYNEDSSQRASLHYTGLFVPGVKWPGLTRDNPLNIYTNKQNTIPHNPRWLSLFWNFLNKSGARCHCPMCVARQTDDILAIEWNKTLFRQPATLNWVARLTLWLVSVVWPISAQISAASTGARADTCPAPRTCTVTAITRADTRGPRAGLQTRGDLADSIWSLRVKGQYWQ